MPLLDGAFSGLPFLDYISISVFGLNARLRFMDSNTMLDNMEFHLKTNRQ